MLLLDGGVGFTAGDRLELSEKQRISPPPPSMLLGVLGDCHPTPQNCGESFSGEYKSGDRVLSM